MNFKNEKQLIRVIRFAVPIIILLLSIIISTFLYFENNSDIERIKYNVEKEFIENKKHIIKEQIENIYDYIIEEQKDTEQNLKNSLIKRVHEAHTIITNINTQYKDTHTKEEIALMVKTSLKDIRFNNNRGYFFVYDKKAINIIHPLNPKLEGKNLINYQDTKGIYVLRESLELLKTIKSLIKSGTGEKSKVIIQSLKKLVL